MKQLLRSFRYLRPYWHLAMGSLLSMFLSAGAMLLLPRLQQMAIDQGIVLGDMGTVLRLALLAIGLALVRGVFQFGQGALAARSAQGVAYDMRNDVYAKIQSLSFSYHDQVHTGQLLTRATSDVDRVQGFIGRGAVMLLSALFMIGGSVLLLFTLNARLARIMLIVVPVTLGLFALFAKAAFPLQALHGEAIAVVGDLEGEGVGGLA